MARLPLAHVRYVEEGPDGTGPTIGDLFAEVFTDPLGAGVVAALLAAVVVVAIVLPRLRRWQAFRATLNGALTDYADYLPWILRLSTGIALMGAGLGGYLYAPHLETHPRAFGALLLTAAGFTLLVGVAVRLAAVLALLAWAYTFAVHGPDVFMTSEVAAALVVLTMVSAGRPSVDDLLTKVLPAAPPEVRPAGRLRSIFGPRPDHDLSYALATWVPVVLRIGLGLSLLYAGFVEKLLFPGPAMDAAARYGLDVGPLTPATWSMAAGLIEILLGLGLILGIAVRPLSVAAFLVLTLTLFALPDDPVLAHVPLWGIASAVFILGCGPFSVDRERMRRAVAMQE